MIEMLLLAMILAKVVQNGVVDSAFAIRGKPSPRYAAAQKRSWRPSGAAARYFGQLWGDSWESQLQRHNRRVERRASRPPGPTATDRWKRGLMAFRYARWNAHNQFKRGWARLDEKRREKATRPRPGHDTVPGQVVPNRPQDETGDGPQDGDEVRPQDEDGSRPDPEPVFVPREDGTTGLRFGDDPTDPNAVSTCPECGGRGVVDGTICPSCHHRQQLRNQHYDEQEEIRTTPSDIQTTPTPQGDQQAPPATQEGTPTMTATTIEVVGLDSAIRFCEDSARAYRAQIQAIEQTQAALAAGDVTGPAAETFSQAMEQSNQAAASMDSAAAELLRHKQVQEAYLANQGAGTRDFILAGQ